MTDTPPDEAAARRAPLPPWVYLLVSLLLAAIPVALLMLGAATVIRDFFFGLYEDFALIQPFRMIGAYFDHLSTCPSTTLTYSDACHWSQYIVPGRIVGSFVMTVGTVAEQGGASATLLLILSLLVGLGLALSATRMMSDGELNLFTFCLGVVLAPVFGGIVAFVLQWIAMGLSLALGYLAMALIWAGAFLSKGWEWYQKARDVIERAELIERAHAAVTPPPPP